MDSTTKQQVLERIRKLLAMAKDASSPNEAAIAARRAEAMMRKYNLSNAEELLSELRSDARALTKQDVTVSLSGKVTKDFPIWASWLSVYVGRLFDTAPRLAQAIHPERPGEVISVCRFYGYTTDVEVSVWMLRYLTATILRLTAEYRARTGATFGQGFSFTKGAALGVCDAISAVLRERAAEEAAQRAANSTCTAVALFDAKRAALREHFGIDLDATSGRRSRVRSDASLSAGYVAGRQVDVKSRPLPEA